LLVPGSTYRLSFTYDNFATGSIYIGGATPTGVLTIPSVFVATSSAVYIYFRGPSGGAGIVNYDNISVKEVTTIGNATLFQDSAGTTPVTMVEQNVGLILDQSQGGVGPELVTNGGFSTSANWTLSSTTITGGNLVFGVAFGYASQAISGTAGTYKLLVNKSVGFAGAGNLTFAFYNAGSIVGSAISIGSATLTFGSGIITASGSFDEIRIVCSTTDAYQVDSVSLIRAPGNHAYVTADANRGILRSRFNQLTYSEQFDNAVWTKSNSFIQTNLLTFSEQFDNAAWFAGSTTVSANATTAPDGTSTADLVYVATTGASRYIWRTASVFTASAQVITSSFYLKASSWTWVMVNGTGTNIGVWFNISTGQKGTESPGITGTITNAENGWWRVTVTETRTGTVQPTVFLADADNSLTATASGTNGIYIWGAQLVQGSVPGDYRATTASALPILYTDPLGGLTAMELGLPSGGGLSQFFQPPSITSASLTDSIWIRSDTPVTLAFGFYDTGAGDVININVTTSWQRVTHTRAAGLTGVDRRACWLYKGSAGGATVQIWGGQFVQTAVFPTNTYQRIAATTDYATGPAFPLYIQTDGTNDAMLTNTINFANGPSNPPLGPELVTNGDFASGTTSGFTATSGNVGGSSVISGELNVVAGGGGSGGFYQDMVVPTNAYIRVNVTGRKIAGAGSTRFQVFNGASFGTLLSQLYDITTVATATSYQVFLGPVTSGVVRIYLYADTSTTGGFDDISVKEMDSAYAPDKMTVATGVTKLSDSGVGVLAELSPTVATSAGSFAVYAPNSGANYSSLLFGSSLAGRTATTYTAPVTSVLATLYDIGQSTTAGETAIQVNGTTPTVTDIAGPAGTGNFGNYPLYLFARNNSLLYFNGYFYGAVVVQKYLSAGELASLTNWMEVRTFGKDMSYSYDYLTLDNGDLVTLDNGDPVYTNIYYS
jgi:hypothetical protein